MKVKRNAQDMNSGLLGNSLVFFEPLPPLYVVFAAVYISWLTFTLITHKLHCINFHMYSYEQCVCVCVFGLLVFSISFSTLLI